MTENAPDAEEIATLEGEEMEEEGEGGTEPDDTAEYQIPDTTDASQDADETHNPATDKHPE